MDKNKLSLNDYQLFLLKAFFWLAFVWAGFISALADFFYAPLIWAFALASGIWFTIKIIRSRISLKISREMWVSCASLFILSILFAFLSTPTVFSGRDQGSISEAAARLANNHSLEFSSKASSEFFKIYGPGKALNFPGFYYTESGNLTTQFPLVYITWLALFYAPFGIAGFAIANAVLLFIFFMSFYLLARLFLKTALTIPLILFATTSFVFMWFSKMTLSENMALPILWLSILSLSLFLRGQRRLYYGVFLSSIFLLCFTRIEGLAFFIFGIAILALHEDCRFFIKYGLKTRLIFPLGFLLIILVANTIQDLSFYTELAKTLFPNLSSPKAQLLGDFKNTVLPDFYVMKIFFIYGILGFFLLGAVGTSVEIWKKDWHRLVPFFVIFPTIIYFFDSHITLDHPWMLRRFSFSLLPCAILYSGLLVGRLLEKNYRDSDKKARIKLAFGSAIIIFLLAGNFPTFFRYLTFSENKTLLEQTEALSQKFGENDLILIDRKATDDGWTMISGPMNFIYGKNAAYFFNTHDLEKLDTKAFDNVYLIASNQESPRYINSVIGEKFEPEGEYRFTFSKLDEQEDEPFKKIGFPEKENKTVNGKIFKLKK